MFEKKIYLLAFAALGRLPTYKDTPEGIGIFLADLMVGPTGRNKSWVDLPVAGFFFGVGLIWRHKRLNCSTF